MDILVFPFNLIINIINNILMDILIFSFNNCKYYK